MDSKNTKKIVLVMVIISILLLVVVSLAFLFFFQNQEKDDKKVVKTASVSMTYKSTSNVVVLKNLTPMSDEVGKDLREEGSYFDFAVTSNVNDGANIQYEIALTKDKSSTIPDDNIRVYLEKQSSGTYSKVFDPMTFVSSKKKTKVGTPSKSMVLNKVSLSSDKVDNYRLRIWLKEGTVLTEPNPTYAVSVNVYGKAI